MSIAPKSLAPRAPSTHEWRQPSTKTDSETGEVWTYHYDALGNLLSVDLPDGRLIEYVIDGQNRRIGKRIDGVLTKAWLYKDQLKPIAELDGSGNLTARFIYGSKTNVPDVILRYATGTVTRYRVISDHLGSPVMAVNVDNPAEVPFAAEYSAFGEMTVTTGASSNDWMPFGFAGGLYDADTELVRLGARDYDAVIGRWTAKDLMRWGGGQSSLYAYVGNDPVNRVDLTGLCNYGAGETRAMMDEAVGFYGNQNLPAALWSALANNSAARTGQYDFRFRNDGDTFSVEGVGTLSASEFGNYFAGYVNHGAFGSFGDWSTQLGGHVFAFSEYRTLDGSLDSELIARGAYDYEQRYGNGCPNFCGE